MKIIEDFFVSRETSQELEFSDALSQKNFCFALKYLQGENTEKIALIRRSIYHFNRLYIVKSQLEKNISYPIALKKLTPPLFFKQAPSFEKSVKLWSSSQLLKAISLFKKSELLAKQNPEINLTPIFHQITKLAS